MDVIITLIRLPFGIISSIAVVLFWLIIFPFESILMIIALPFAAIFMDRCDIKYSWIGKYPNSIRKIPEVLQDIWSWVRGDSNCGI